MQVSLEYPASGERQDRLQRVLVDDDNFSALGVFYEMDGRKSRYIGEVLDSYREQDSGDLRRRYLSELVG